MSRHLPLLSGVVFQSILSYQMKEVVRGGHREGWTRWSRRNEGLQVELQPLIAGLGYSYRRLSNLPRMGAATHVISVLVPTLCSVCSPLRGTWNSVSDVLRTPATRRSARGKMIVHYHGFPVSTADQIQRKPGSRATGSSWSLYSLSSQLIIQPPSGRQNGTQVCEQIRLQNTIHMMLVMYSESQDLEP